MHHDQRRGGGAAATVVQHGGATTVPAPHATTARRGASQLATPRRTQARSTTRSSTARRTSRWQAAAADEAKAHAGRAHIIFEFRHRLRGGHRGPHFGPAPRPVLRATRPPCLSLALCSRACFETAVRCCRCAPLPRAARPWRRSFARVFPPSPIFSICVGAVWRAGGHQCACRPRNARRSSHRLSRRPCRTTARLLSARRRQRPRPWLQVSLASPFHRPLKQVLPPPVA